MGEYSAVTRILGIDPGSRTTGFGVIDIEGQRQQYVTSGCIRAGDGDMPSRLATIFAGVQSLVAEHEPGEVAIERVFMHRNADSALKLGQARGAALCAVLTVSIPVFEFTATEVKQSVVGRGNASKDQVQHMVSVLLSLSGHPQADAADALAVALCHANTRQTLGQMPGVRGMRGGRLR